jgi:hypothetical protein
MGSVWEETQRGKRRGREKDSLLATLRVEHHARSFVDASFVSNTRSSSSSNNKRACSMCRSMLTNGGHYDVEIIMLFTL